MHLILTQKAYGSIVEECSSFYAVETGGILVGRRIDKSNIVVPFIIGSGPEAERSLARYSPDVDWQQKSLEKLFARYQVNYVGSFHRHPGALNYPSSLDYKTACRITSSPDWGVSEGVFPIIIFKEKDVKFFPYYLSQREKEFQIMTWEIVSSRHQLVREALRRRTNETPETQNYNHRGHRSRIGKTYRQIIKSLRHFPFRRKSGSDLQPRTKG